MRPLLLILLAVGVSPGAQPAGPDVPRFQVASTQGVTTGTIFALATDGTLEIEAGERVRLGPDGWYAHHRLGESTPPLPEGPHLVTTGDDCLAVLRPRLDNERLTFEHPDLDGGKPCSLSLGAVRLLWWMAPTDTLTEVLRRRLLRETRKSDLTLLRNGDRVVGVPTQLDGFRLSLQIPDGTRSLEIKQLACLALNSDLAELLRPKGRAYRVLFRNPGGKDCSRVTLATVSSDGEMLGGKTLFGATLRLPIERVDSLEVLGGPADSLTDLKPGAITQAPYLDVRWPVGFDGTSGDRDLCLGGSNYGRGLSMAAGMSITYPLAGKYRRFEASVGLDPRQGRAGGVRLEILLDGKPVKLEKSELIGAETILRISADTTGAKELKLMVHPGRRGTVQGHVNWVEPRLVK